MYKLNHSFLNLLARLGQRGLMVVIMLLISSLTTAAGDLTVTINGTITKTNQSSILMALNGIQENITSIKISAGSFTQNDWNALKSLSTKLNALEAFIITQDVTVADIDGQYFNNTIKTISIATVQNIGNNAFEKLHALTTVYIPMATNIGEKAFYNCTNLTQLGFGNTPPTVLTDAFTGCPRPCFIQLIDTEFNPLTGDALIQAQNAYMAVNDGNTTDNQWHGWFLEAPKALKIKINNNTTEYIHNSLQEAIATSGVALDEIKTLEIDGDMLGADLAYMNNSLNSLETLYINTSIETLYWRINNGNLVNFTATDIKSFTGYFETCSNLTSINLPGTIHIVPNAFSYIFSLSTVNLPAITTVDNEAFTYNHNLTSINITSATIIGNLAFCGCIILPKVHLPMVTNIGDEAFMGCQELTQLELGATPPTVGNNAFDGCPNTRYLLLVDANGKPLTGEALASAQEAYQNTPGWDGEKWHGWSLPTIVVSVNGGAPIADTSLEATITASKVALNAITSIEVIAGDFKNADWVYIQNKRAEPSALETFIIADGIASVADIPAASKTKPIFGSTLKTLKAAKLISIGNNACYGCSNLTELNLPAATTIGEYAFNSCTALTEIDFPQLITVENAAFENCSSLTTMNIPAVTSIGASAFKNCTNLAEIYLPEATSIINLAFKDCINLTTAYLPKITELIFGTFNGCVNLSTVHIPKVTKIQGGVFQNCTSLTSLSIPAVQTIVTSAFDNCTSLTTLSIPAAQTLSSKAFSNCTNLTTLMLGATPPNANADNTFEGCPDERYLVLVDADGTPLTGDALTTAQETYKAHKGWANEKWYGWTLVSRHTITVIASPAEGGTVIGADNYYSNSTVTLDITPNSGYYIKSVRAYRTDDNTVEVSVSNHTLTMPNYDVTVEVEFEVCGVYYFTAIAHNSYNWDGEILTESGDYPRPYTAPNGCNTTVTLYLTVLHYGLKETGLTDARRENLSVYPNPTSDLVYMVVPDGFTTPISTTPTIEIMVYNANGQLMQRIPMHGASERMAIDLSRYPSGMYIIRLGNASAKVVKM